MMCFTFFNLVRKTIKRLEVRAKGWAGEGWGGGGGLKLTVVVYLV